MPIGAPEDQVGYEEDKKNLLRSDNDDYGAIVSGLAGIGSGLFKIPEQFVSLGAELIDLGFDTDMAASVESFFDKINPFDEVAESTTAGKLTETLVSLGIPSTAGYSLATKLARRALQAKRTNKYIDLKKFGKSKTLSERKESLKKKILGKDPATGRTRKVRDALVEEVEKLTPGELRKRSLFDKSYVFGAGLGGSGIADFVFADPDIGTIGDEFGGITRRDTDEDFGRDEALRELTNRLKFAGEGAVLTSVLGGIGTGIAKGAKAVKYKMQYDALDNSIKKIIADFAPQGVKPREIFELLETRKNEIAKFQTEGQAYGRRLEQTVDDILKQAGKAGDDSEKIKFGEVVNTFLTTGQRTDLDRYLDELGLDNPELGGKLFTAIDNARGSIDNYSNAILKILPDTPELAPLRDAIKKNLGEYATTKYALIERKGALGKVFAKYKPTDEAYKTAYDYVLNEIKIGKQQIAKGIDPSIEKDFKGIVPEKGVAEEDQAKSILNRLLSDDVKYGENSIPDQILLKKLGLELEDGILKAKKLPKELKEFYGEIKNPFYNISSTIAKQGALITEIEMLGNLGKLAKGKIFFDSQEEAAKALGARRGDIVSVGKLTSLPINQEITGLYTTREIAESFQDQALNAEKGALSKLYSFFVLAPKRTSQEAKTIFSPFTHVRNIISAGAFTLMNGNLSITNPGRTADAFKKSFEAFKKGKDSQEAFDLYLDYTRRGITGTNPLIGEMIDMGSRAQKLNDFGAEKQMGETINVLAEGFGKLRRKITDTYMAEDDFWKIYNYNFEQGNYNGFVSKFIARSPELKELGEDRARKAVSKLIEAGKDIDNIPRTIIDQNTKKVVNNPLYETKLKNRLELIKDETGLDVAKSRAVLEKLKSRVGKLVGRKDINYNDPIFYQPKNTLRKIEGESEEAFARRLRQEVIEGEDAVEALVKNLSADVTKNNIPNYAYVGKNIKALRNLPLGTFVAFPAEIIRTGFNTIQRAARELSMAETRDIGMRRMAGVLGTGAALPVGAVALGKQLSGFTNEEMEALRRFVPSWSENSLLVPTGRDEKTGNVQYLDLSYIYPYDSLLRPARTVMNQLVKGEETNQGITTRLAQGGIKAMSELAKPFLSEAIFIEAANDILLRGGRTRQGSQVFRSGDPLGEKLYKTTMHIMDTFTPGSLDAAMRIGGAPFNVADRYGRTYDLADEVPGIFGFRNIEVDPAQTMKFMIGDFNKQVSSARATFLGDVLRGGAITPDQILKEYLGAEESRFRAFKDMYKNIEAANILGIKSKDLDRQLDRLPKSTRSAIVSGTYRPYKPSKEVRKLFYENALRLAQQTGSAPIDPLQGSLQKIYDYIGANTGRSLTSELDINFSLPETSAVDNLANFLGSQATQQAATQEQKKPITTSGVVVPQQGGIQTIDQDVAGDILAGDDEINKALFKQGNL